MLPDLELFAALMLAQLLQSIYRFIMSVVLSYLTVEQNIFKIVNRY